MLNKKKSLLLLSISLFSSFSLMAEIEQTEEQPQTSVLEQAGKKISKLCSKKNKKKLVSKIKSVTNQQEENVTSQIYNSNLTENQKLGLVDTYDQMKQEINSASLPTD